MREEKRRGEKRRGDERRGDERREVERRGEKIRGEERREEERECASWRARHLTTGGYVAPALDRAVATEKKRAWLKQDAGRAK
ncbi:hypothetical protein KM043_010894 [Ampulex compressa]|nr:hypothetical protein KM043_010894 [Ampulex compressa]